MIHQLVDTDPPDVVVVFGMHLHPKSPNYIMAEGAWDTPFGSIPVHTTMAEALIAEFPFRIETPHNFTKDNTIELQLPFIKYFFPNTKAMTIGLPPVESSLALARATVASWNLVQEILSVLSEDEMRTLVGLLERVRQKAFDYAHPGQVMQEVTRDEQKNMTQFLARVRRQKEEDQAKSTGKETGSSPIN